MLSKATSLYDKSSTISTILPAADTTLQSQVDTLVEQIESKFGTSEISLDQERQESSCQPINQSACKGLIANHMGKPLVGLDDASICNIKSTISEAVKMSETQLNVITLTQEESELMRDVQKDYCQSVEAMENLGSALRLQQQRQRQQQR